MSTLGTVTIPESSTNLVFPLKPDYPFVVVQAPQIVSHLFNSGDRKITQRFVIGENTRRFQVSFNKLTKDQFQSLLEFHNDIGGQYKTFLFDVPKTDGTTDRIRVRLVDDSLRLALQSDCIAQGLTITLAEVPASTPAHTITSTLNRFPSESLNTALLGQVQEVVPIIKIAPKSCPAIYVSDRHVTIGGTEYQPRLTNWDGIGQSVDGASDQASFTFGNADRVWSELTKTVNLVKARIEFSLYHVGTGTKIDLWAGDVTNWAFDSGTDFRVDAADGLWELRQTYPRRKVSRNCWKTPNTSNCPYTGTCDRTWDTCGAHNSFGGVLANPETVYLGGVAKAMSDNSFTSKSVVDDNLLGKPLPQVFMDVMSRKRIENGVETWADAELGVDAMLAAVRDENEYLVGLGVFNDGEITEFGTGHTLDGAVHHGASKAPYTLGLRLGYGFDPVPTSSSDGFEQFFNLSETGNTYAKDKRAAGTSFVEIRTVDEEGKQLRKVTEHQMKVWIRKGVKGWSWDAPGTRVWSVLHNPVWIAINLLLWAKGIHQETAANQEAFFDVEKAILDAAFCEQTIDRIITGNPSSTRRRYDFRGVIKDEKPLRDWIQEVLNTCLGGFTCSFGKLRTFLRANSGSVSAFTEGNIIADSLSVEPINPAFNQLTIQFGNLELDGVNDAVTIAAHEHAALIGTSISPKYLKADINLAGISSRDEAAVWAATRLKEELGGATQAEWTAARKLAFRTTILALETEPGMVCSLTHPDLPVNETDNGTHEFRIISWKLNKDYTVDISGRSVTDSVYDLLQGPNPADIEVSALPEISSTSLIPADVTNVVAGTPVQDQLTVTVPVTFTPPSPKGSFEAVAVYILAPSDATKAIFAGRHDIDWTQVDGSGNYTIDVDITRPFDADSDAVIYLVAASQVYERKLDLTNTPHTAVISILKATPLGDVVVGDVSNLTADWTTTETGLKVTVTGTAPIDDNFAGCEMFLAIPKDSDPDPEHPTAPLQLYPQGWHYGESSTAQATKQFTATLEVPAPPLDYLQSLATPKVTWVIYALPRTWGGANRLVLLTDVAGMLPANHTPLATLTMDFTDYITGKSSQDLGSVTLSGSPTATVGSSGLDISQDYVPPYFGIPGAFSIGSFEGVSAIVEYPDGKTVDCGSHPYTKDSQANPPGNIETLRVTCPMPASLPATLYLHMMSYSPQDRQKFKKVWNSGVATVHAEYAIATVTVTSATATVPTPTISGVVVEYRDIPGSKAKQYHLAISLSNVPTASSYGGTYFDIQDTAAGSWQYKAQEHVAGAPSSPVQAGDWWTIQPGESRSFKVKGWAYLASNPNTRASTNEVTVTVSLALDDVVPPVSQTGFSLAIAEYSGGMGGDPHAKIVGSFTMPTGSDLVSGYVCEKPYGYSGTPSFSDYTGEFTTSTGSFEIWKRRPQAGARIFILLASANAANGVWRPVDGTCPVAYVDLDPWTALAAATNCSVSVTNAHVIDGTDYFDLAINFTAPTSQDYWYMAVGRIPRANASYTPIEGATFEQHGDFGEQQSFVAKDIKAPKTAEYWTYRFRPVNWQGVPNDAAVVYVNVTFPAAGGIDLAAAKSASLNGLEVVDGKIQPKLGSNFNLTNGVVNLGTVEVAKLSGQIAANQIGSVNASSISGSIAADQIGAVNASSISGSIAAGQITSLTAAQITGVIVTSQLADSIMNSARLMGSNMPVPVQVSALPTLPNAEYPSGCFVQRTSDKTLWKNNAGTWQASSASAITGNITKDDISSVNASAINGLITAGMIESINVGQIVGTIQASQIAGINANQISGTISGTQIDSIAASKISGSISSDQIGSIAASKITGSISAAQIESVNASAITGTITATNIGSVNATSVTMNASNQLGTIYCSGSCHIEGQYIGGSISVTGSVNAGSGSFTTGVSIGGDTIAEAAFCTIGTGPGQVAAGDHTHSEYASASHTHSGYAAADHTHSGYAASNHTHTVSVTLGYDVEAVQGADLVWHNCVTDVWVQSASIN